MLWVTAPAIFSSNLGESNGTNASEMKKIMDERGEEVTIISASALKMGLRNAWHSAGLKVSRYIDPLTGLCEPEGPADTSAEAVNAYVDAHIDLALNGFMQTEKKPVGKKDPGRPAVSRLAQFACNQLMSCTMSNPGSLLGTNANTVDGVKPSNSIFHREAHCTRYIQPNARLHVAPDNCVNEERYDRFAHALVTLPHCGGGQAAFLASPSPAFMIARVTEGIETSRFDHRLVTIDPGSDELNLDRLEGCIEMGMFGEPETLHVAGIMELTDGQVERLQSLGVTMHNMPADLFKAVKAELY